MTTMPGVIPSLIEVLTEARVDAGRELRHLRYHYDRTERQLARYEAGDSLPPAGELDQFVGAYAVETTRSPFDLWDEAIDRARKADGAVKRTPAPSRRLDPKAAAEAAARPLRGTRKPKAKRQTGS